MKENFLDEVAKGVDERYGWFREEMDTKYKNVKKFGQEPLSRKQSLENYDSLAPEDIMNAYMNQVQFYKDKQVELLQNSPPEQAQMMTQKMYKPEELAREDLNEFIWEHEKLRGQNG